MAALQEGLRKKEEEAASFQLARAQLQDQMDKTRQQIARDAKEDRVTQGRLEERHGQEVARLEERHGKVVAELKEQHSKEMQKLNDDWEEEQVVEMNLLDTELERLRDERCVLLIFSVHLSWYVFDPDLLSVDPDL